MPEFHAGAPQATVSEGLAQGPYVTARAGVEPMTLRLKAIETQPMRHHSAKESRHIFTPPAYLLGAPSEPSVLSSDMAHGCHPCHT